MSKDKIMMRLSMAIAGLLMLMATATRAATYTWTGDGEDGVWENAANWSGGATVPDSANDTATIESDSSIAISVAGDLTLGALTLGGDYTGMVTLGGTLTVSDAGGESGNLTVNVGTLQSAKDTTGAITVDGTFAIGSSGTVVMRRASTSGDGTGQTITTVNLTLEGTIDADQQGFDPIQGPGTSNSNADGGSHGGHGGDHFEDGIAGTYGSFENPTALGSGGGGLATAGAEGGGAVIIVASGTVQIDGLITADGGTGNRRNGSGGTVNITTANLAGTGTIQARGASSDLGGGGGGRLAFSVSGTDTFSGTLDVSGGVGTGRPGYAGTIYLSQQKRDNLILGGTGNMTSLRLGTDHTMGPNGPTNYTFGAVLINDGGMLEVDGNRYINDVSGVDYGSSAVLNMNSLTVESGGFLSTKGRGFYVQTGPGGASGNADGGSYGGLGGDYDGSGGAPGGVGPTYGGITNPVALGSGGHGHSSKSAWGGGAVILSVSGAVTNNGVIQADGGAADNRAGAGGSIRIETDTLTGNGTIRANGGSVGPTGFGGGGGGRVAVYVTSGSDIDNVTLQAQGGNATRPGAAGTVYLEVNGNDPGTGVLSIDTPYAPMHDYTVTELPAGLNPALYQDELAALTLVVTNQAIVGLTADITVGDLYLADNGFTRLYLNGYTLNVDQFFHEDWGSEDIVDYSAGGAILWKQPPPGSLFLMR